MIQFIGGTGGAWFRVFSNRILFHRWWGGVGALQKKAS